MNPHYNIVTRIKFDLTISRRSMLQYVGYRSVKRTGYQRVGLCTSLNENEGVEAGQTVGYDDGIWGA